MSAASAIRWGKLNLEDKQTHIFKIGLTTVYLKKADKEVWNAFTQKEIKQGSIDWSRWSYEDSNLEVNFSPQLPNRAIVVKPESPFRLLSNASAKIYVRVPIWLKIELQSRKESASFEIPSVVLSNTWFGDFLSGELCYWLSTSARRGAVKDSSKQHLITCPINITNKSSEDLLVEKLRLQVDLLSVYDDQTNLWSNETKVVYRGGSEISQVEINRTAPNETKDPKLLSTPRRTGKKRSSGRTFGNVFELSGLGFG